MWKCFWEWLWSLPPSSANFGRLSYRSGLRLGRYYRRRLFNAYLIRRRNDRQRKIEARTLAVALKAGLAGLNQSLIERLSSGTVGTGVAALVRPLFALLLGVPATTAVGNASHPNKPTDEKARDRIDTPYFKKNHFAEHAIESRHP